MNNRPLRVLGGIVAVGTAITCLWLYLPRMTAVLANPTNQIVVRSVYDKNLPTDWMQFVVYLPIGQGPLRYEEELIVDGVNHYGIGATPIMVDGQPKRLRFRIDSSLDRRVKEIIKAQGLKVDPRIITYDIDTFFEGAGSTRSETMRFAHGRGRATTLGTGSGPYHLGQNIVLFDQTIYDSSIKEYPHERYSDAASFASYYPHGEAHRLAFQVRFSKETRPWP